MSFCNLTEVERIVLTDDVIPAKRIVLERRAMLEILEAEPLSNRAAIATESSAANSVTDRGCGTMSLQPRLRAGAPVYLEALRELYGVCDVCCGVSDAPETLLPRKSRAWVNDFDAASRVAIFETADRAWDNRRRRQTTDNLMPAWLQ